MADWTPVQIGSSLEVWLDADDSSTIHTDDVPGDVSKLDDKSGNGNHYSQSTGSKQPSTAIETINGKNAIGFDGIDDELETSSNPFGATVSNAHIFIVKQTPSSLSNGTDFSLTGSDTSANRWQAHLPYGSGTAYFDCGGTGSPNRITKASYASTSEDFLGSCYCSTTDGVQELWKNGTLEASDASGHSVSTVGNLVLGNSGGSQYADAAIGEVIIINGTCSRQLRQKIEGYLAWKWGLEGSLPSDHPYKHYAPLADAWEPPTDSSYDLWLDADDPDEITPGTGDGVLTWGDKSGNSRDVSQATASKQPETGTRTIQGRNALDFDASAIQDMETAAAATWLNGGDYSIFVIYKCDVSSGNDYYIGTRNSSTDKGLHCGMKDTNILKHGHYGDDNDYSLTRDTAVHLFTQQYYDPDGVLYNNGNQVALGTKPDNDLNTDAVLAVGAGHNTAYAMDGLIGELIVIRGVILNPIRERIEGYLAWKWGLQGSLPATHTFKNKPPKTGDILPLTEPNSAAASTLDHVVPAGNNRGLIAFFSWEDDVNGTSITGATYGGQAMTEVFQIKTADTGFTSGVACYYINDAGIAAAVGDTITPTYSATPNEEIIHARSYENMAQTSPVVETKTAETNASTPNPFTTIDITEADGNLIVGFVTSGNATTAAWASDMIERTDQADASSSSSMADRLSYTSGNVDIECTNTSQNRAAGGSAEIGKYVAPSGDAGLVDAGLINSGLVNKGLIS